MIEHKKGCSHDYLIAYQTSNGSGNQAMCRMIKMWWSSYHLARFENPPPPPPPPPPAATLL